MLGAKKRTPKGAQYSACRTCSFAGRPGMLCSVKNIQYLRGSGELDDEDSDEDEGEEEDEEDAGPSGEDDDEGEPEVERMMACLPKDLRSGLPLTICFASGGAPAVAVENDEVDL
eukprot:1161795-Pelagomonas_calceolata.AAC.2